MAVGISNVPLAVTFCSEQVFFLGIGMGVSLRTQYFYLISLNGTTLLPAVRQPQKVVFVTKVVFCACKEYNIDVLGALKGQ
jgi:hypothetical protein